MVTYKDEQLAGKQSQKQINLTIGQESITSVYLDTKTKRKLQVFSNPGSSRPLGLLSKDLAIRVSKDAEQSGSQQWVKVMTPDIQGWSMLDNLGAKPARKTDRSFDCRAKINASPQR